MHKHRYLHIHTATHVNTYANTHRYIHTGSWLEYRETILSLQFFCKSNSDKEKIKRDTDCKWLQQEKKPRSNIFFLGRAFGNKCLFLFWCVLESSGCQLHTLVCDRVHISEWQRWVLECPLLKSVFKLSGSLQWHCLW